MNDKEVRVRFAPSPTGNLHVGGARTALFNWIFAKSKAGKFLLRIEDTDKARSKAEFTESILESLKWFGISWDEKIFYQSEHIDEHRRAAETLLKNGAAYKCFCTPETLERKRKEAPKDSRTFRYDGTCRNLSAAEVQAKEEAGERYAVRFKTMEGETVFHDMIHGRTVFSNAEIDDFVILRGDNTPTYMLAVIVDDFEMNISHVVRGDDHISNTPKQIMLYKALGWDVPEFGHMPIILGPDKARLSKRHGADSVKVYRERGYLPEAVFNYITLLGWSPGDDREILSAEEVFRLFKIENSQKKSAVFDEQKLLWMNDMYISGMPDSDLALKIMPILENDTELKQLVSNRGEKYLEEVLELSKNRLKLLTDFNLYCGYYYRDPATFDPKAVKKHWKDERTKEFLARVRICLKECEDYSIEGIESAIRSLADEQTISAAKLIHPTRLALTGFGVSPGIFELLFILGRETVVRRLENAVQHLEGTA